ncbi:hypothetical protein D5018_13910 [Parashewanella curva]|uniref:Haemolysin activator HlyB C-terminal domain-containing protein n=1 Tax=Parashewanella curva TaxID=2338552 RepID=A0A3L8PUL7_9GAMM|nr:hypothetical protein [Parashewanella curva]RLV59101.1 hypothetical protein D5018_13910 [Parashewanella curva]
MAMFKQHVMLLAFIFCLFKLSPVWANDEQAFVINQITIINHSIFDQSSKDNFFIHDWANSLHTTTKKSVIRNHLIFQQGDKVTSADLNEAQRILRSKRYLRDAKVYFAPLKNKIKPTSKTVVVETWDNWSLLPTADFNRTGNESRYSVGVKDDNLMGLGIRTRLKYNHERDRNGYHASVSAPINWIEHGIATIGYERNSDGQVLDWSLIKPFYSNQTKTSFSITHDDDHRVDEIEQNGDVVNKFAHSTRFYSGQYGWLLHNDQQALSRFRLGVTQQQDRFSPTSTLSVIPKDRKFFYPWVGFQYIQNDYHEFNNVRVLDKNEDINLGWTHTLKLGFELDDKRNNNLPGYHINIHTTKGHQQDNNLWLFSLNGNATLATSHSDYYRLDLQSEFFHFINPKWIFYSKAKLSFTNNLPLDLLNSLGDDSGLRGYPLQYQHGDNTWLLSAEIRRIPNINLFELADIALVAFADVGQAYGSGTTSNQDQGILTSIGAGLRIYSSKSSNNSVGHIDLVYPINSDPSIQGLEFRFTVKQSL